LPPHASFEELASLVGLTEFMSLESRYELPQEAASAAPSVR
jgi:hypothetical protein